ncbi:MAG TPA: hypothetical protein VGI33_18335 [Paenibacillus sp.]
MMLRPGMSLALSLTGTFVDALLRTDFAIRKHPSYKGGLAHPLIGLSPLDNVCLWARKIKKDRLISDHEEYNIYLA